MRNSGRARGFLGLLSVVGVVILCWLCFGLWYSVASDYSDGVTSGTYYLAQNGETSTLILKPDHSFQQVLNRSGNIQHAEGTWRHVSSFGGLAFSKGFLVVRGQELGANCLAYGDLNKLFGLFPGSITLSTYDIEWYGKVTSVAGETASGTYAGDEEGVPATLNLKPDHTFEQTVTHGGIAKHAQGSWTLSQAGDIVFSKSFIKTTGESVREDETASTVGGTGASIQIEIAVNPKLGVPTFRKRLFTW
ncbi:MAG: hypothetical protein WAK26_10075 [Terracidiphilus sp.]